ncbi:class I SAM-dependent methyltransferase [Candidatus Nanosalina sp. VS9-1]|uniref:class I SAM-dependent methyltransferase n=1 Tax=Candidatus Nanosalina sp. VS9-1 TaxID=3388566 RepID=UPI0039E0AAED
MRDNVEGVSREVWEGRQMTDENGFYGRHTNFGGRYRKIEAAVESELDIDNYDSINILDVGTSKGKALNTMIGNLDDKYDTDFVATGLDASPEHASTADRQPEIHHGVAGDINSLPFPDGSFDIVICNALIPYLPDNSEEVEYTDNNPHYEALTEIERVLGSEGVAAVELVNDRPYEEQYIFHPDEMEKLLDENSSERSLEFNDGIRLSEESF